MSELIEVDFKPRVEPNGPAMRIKSRHEQKCKHTRQTIDEELRTVGCRDCDEQLDPVQVLVHWARDWDNVDRTLRRNQRETRLLNQEIEELKRQKKNLAAQVARLRGKLQ